MESKNYVVPLSSSVSTWPTAAAAEKRDLTPFNFPNFVVTCLRSRDIVVSFISLALEHLLAPQQARLLHGGPAPYNYESSRTQEFGR